MVETRNSLPKKVICKTLASMNHPTACQIYEQVRTQHPQISLGTVYRNLGNMANSGEVLRLAFLGEPDRFDPNTFEHYHAVCSDCGAIFDAHTGIDPELIRKLDTAVEQSTGVKIQQRSLLFEGLCANCQ